MGVHARQRALRRVHRQSKHAREPRPDACSIARLPSRSRGSSGSDGQSAEQIRGRSHATSGHRVVHAERGSGIGAKGRAERRVADLRRRPRQHPIRAARSDYEGQLRRSGDCLAVQDGCARPEARVQLPIHAAHGRRCLVLDGRESPGGLRPGRRDRRNALDVQQARRQARRGRAPRTVRTGARVLDRRDQPRASST